MKRRGFLKALAAICAAPGALMSGLTLKEKHPTMYFSTAGNPDTSNLPWLPMRHESVNFTFDAYFDGERWRP